MKKVEIIPKEILTSIKSYNLSNIQMSKLLCGVSSPYITKLGLKKTKYYGLCNDINFNDVLKYLNKNIKDNKKEKLLV